MRSTFIITLAACASAVNVTSAHADDAAGAGPYAGVGFGHSRFEIDPISSTRDTDNGVLRLYGGYQVNSHFAAEAGYVRTGHFIETRPVDGVEITEKAMTRAIYASAIGRMPVTEAFLITGRVGIAYGDVNNDEMAPGPNSVFGSRSSLMFGVGAQYRMSDRLSLALDVDSIAHESRRVSADIVTFSIRRSF
jgi:OOP family OmpA-OmpF porin